MGESLLSPSLLEMLAFCNLSFWILLFFFSIYRQIVVGSAKFPIKISTEMWNWNQFISIFCFLQAGNFALTGGSKWLCTLINVESGSTGFLSVLFLMGSRISYYAMLQLASRHLSPSKEKVSASLPGWGTRANEYYDGESFGDIDIDGDGDNGPFTPSQDPNANNINIEGETLEVTEAPKRHNDGALRSLLSKNESRTILGLTLMGTLSDLVFLTSTNSVGYSGDLIGYYNIQDCLPMTIVEISILGASAACVFRQWRQIVTFQRRIHKYNTPERKLRLYQGRLRYHQILFCLLLLIICIKIVGFTSIAMENFETILEEMDMMTTTTTNISIRRKAIAPPRPRPKVHLIKSSINIVMFMQFSQQSVLLAMALFFIANNINGLLI